MTLTSLQPRRRVAIFLATSVAVAALLPMAASAQGALAPRVKLGTSQGDIVVELYPDKAPKTVENFLQYVRDQHYDGTVFHRVMSNFMIQGGGFTADLQQKPTRPPVALEATNGLKNDRGAIAMARTSNPNSATSQFFINVVNNPNLNAPMPDGYGYTVFGKVVGGMDVVDKIRAVPVGNQGMHQNVPLAPITILKATLEK
ncbi:peptidylprolyl isomerase [Hydrogenophaga laconesensis]|uniref:Peptidyl-prolyl cis-trans isomerase n=1 Tax=Hydrogenophaga laconesensis TaxID=1805971 RepID=A0ABU1V604_9BURK|nr:peptidylprolyl isomerase [Hydrogenophaga laconesensis]MDR7092713.1 peptidyl-prolyl cis-trans isomerase A (cyclophilin A) [Hydrogenophaga laconesensis]